MEFELLGGFKSSVAVWLDELAGGQLGLPVDDAVAALRQAGSRGGFGSVQLVVGHLGRHGREPHVLACLCFQPRPIVLDRDRWQPLLGFLLWRHPPMSSTNVHMNPGTRKLGTKPVNPDTSGRDTARTVINKQPEYYITVTLFYSWLSRIDSDSMALTMSAIFSTPPTRRPSPGTSFAFLGSSMPWYSPSTSTSNPGRSLKP